MANKSFEGKLSSSFDGDGEEDPSDLLMGVEELDLEVFLDSALENDAVLKGILEEGLTQIIRAAIHLLNLQRRRDKGQSQGQRIRVERKLAFKTVTNSGDGDLEAPRVRESPIVADKKGSRSKNTDNNPTIIGTMISVGSMASSAGGEAEGALGGLPQDDYDTHLDPPSDPAQGNELEIPPVDDTEKLSCSQRLSLFGGIKLTPIIQKRGRGRRGPLKHGCKKMFRAPSRLQEHLNTHTNEKPFPIALTAERKFI